MKPVKLMDSIFILGVPLYIMYVTSQKAHDATETFQVLNYTLNL